VIKEFKMATWSVKPEWKKSIIERNYFTKGDNRLMVETGWRWGEFTVYTEDENPPDLSSGVDIYDCGYEAELVETSDGCWEEQDMDECDEETQAWLEEFFEEGNSWLDLEEHGWSQDECEMIIDCDLIIENMDTGEVVDSSNEAEAIAMLEKPTQWPWGPELASTVETAKWPFDTPKKGKKEEE
jgi:hypothetical protein